jgi:hypothetical protein
MSRFYVDEQEIEINDPLFYLPIKKVDQLIKDLTDYKNDQLFKVAQGQ